MSTVFDDHADQAMRDAGSYEAARIAVRRQMADADQALSWHYRGVLASLERRFKPEENTDA